MGRKLGESTAAQKILALHSILLMLGQGQTISLGRLADKLNCSKATVLRLIDQIEAGSLGKIIKTTKMRECHFAFARPKRMPKVSITAEGLQQLMLCRYFVASFLPESMRNATRATLGQVQAFLPEDEDANFSTLGETCSKGQIDYTPFEKQLQTITQCMHNKQVCQIEYRSSLRKEPQMIEIAPLRLQVYRDAMYVRAWMVSEKGNPEAIFDTPTVYALQRIKDAWATRRKTDHLPDVPDDTTGFGFIKGDPFSVTVKFSPVVSTYVAERKWSADQQIVEHDDGSVTLTMSATSDREVIAWVLGFGKEATLLEPANLRDEIAQELTAMQAQYTA